MMPTMVIGSAQRRKRTSRLCALALPRGGRSGALNRGSRGVVSPRRAPCVRSAMSEDINLLPTGDVEGGPGGKEVEAGLGQGHAPFSDQHFIELGLQGVKMFHVGGGIGQLVGRKLGGAPIGTLLGLGDLNTEKFAGDVLQPVPIGVG